jgi:hypothetical protein
MLACGSCFWLFNTSTANSKKIKNKVSLKTDSVNFQLQLKPVFQKNCSPCHFPGGKMYEKMPFDKGETIIHHEAGILSRIKNETEVNLIKQYIGQKNVTR